MGAWGVGPFDNDTAGDMLAKLRTPIECALKQYKDYCFYEEARVCAQILVLSHGTDILGGPGLVDVVKLLVKMRIDKEWITSWRSPRRMAARLDDEIAHVLDVMRACRGCKRKDPDGEPSALNQALSLVEAMEPWKAPRSGTIRKLHGERTTRAGVRKNRKKRRK
jgi:Domain of unknown function (DUF4259)